MAVILTPVATRLGAYGRTVLPEKLTAFGRFITGTVAPHTAATGQSS
ncbi:hypothetical protein [Streptomyces sp. NPDC002785]